MASIDQTVETDVIVVGSGMGGIVAAVRAVEVGADAILLEKGDRVGGTSRVAGGSLAIDKDSEPSTGAFEPIEDGIEWLQSIDAPVEEMGDNWNAFEEERNGSGMKIRPPEFFEHMTALFRDGGGEIMLETPMNDLLTDDTGAITGVRAKNAAGETIDVLASSVVLATGDGIAGNPELVSRYLPSEATILHRGNAWKTGDGFLAALSLGAQVTDGLTVPEGHSTLGPPAQYSLEEMRDATMFFETAAVALDHDGNRFTDETKAQNGNSEFIRDLVYDADGEAFLVIDEDLYSSMYPHVSVRARVEDAREFAGEFVEAETLAELGSGLAEFGVDGDNAVLTIEGFNDAVASGEGERLDPPRRNRQDPLDSPPFFAVGVQAGLEMVSGGLDVTEDAQVLSRPNSISPRVQQSVTAREVRLVPIEGLYAAGAEVGRSEKDAYYRAGLSLGLSTGRIAGKHAAERALADGEA
jgi:succinate dehydrogenase/fumarate reductase flavoprotein subunit